MLHLRLFVTNLLIVTSSPPIDKNAFFISWHCPFNECIIYRSRWVLLVWHAKIPRWKIFSELHQILYLYKFFVANITACKRSLIFIYLCRRTGTVCSAAQSSAADMLTGTPTVHQYQLINLWPLKNSLILYFLFNIMLY